MKNELKEWWNYYAFHNFQPENFPRSSNRIKPLCNVANVVRRYGGCETIFKWNFLFNSTLFFKSF